MSIIKVQCCDCDEYFDIENTRKLKVDGLKEDYYICDTCLEGVPLMQEHVEPVLKKVGA